MFHVILSLALCLIVLIFTYVVHYFMIKNAKLEGYHSACEVMMKARLDRIIKLAGEPNEQENRS